MVRTEGFGHIRYRRHMYGEVSLMRFLEPSMAWLRTTARIPAQHGFTGAYIPLNCPKGTHVVIGGILADRVTQHNSLRLEYT